MKSFILSLAAMIFAAAAMEHLTVQIVADQLQRVKIRLLQGDIFFCVGSFIGQ